MTVEDVARAIAYARKHRGSRPRDVANEALVALADLATERERLLDAWKVVMHRSPIGMSSPELAQATTVLMIAEENVRRALGHEPNTH